MGYVVSAESMNKVLKKLSERYLVYGPKRFVGEGEYSDTDSIRYGEIRRIADLELEDKSEHTFKDALLPISETVLYFTEDSVKESKIPYEKEALIFVRSCDLHSMKRLDAIYLNNVFRDYYYKRLREKVKFALIGCPHAYENCFCVDMGANKADEYEFSIDNINGHFELDVKNEEMAELFKELAIEEKDVVPQFVEDTPTRVRLPKNVDVKFIAKHEMWDQYDKRCIACGRCNFSCPTCTCYTMQDIFYRDNPKSGERRRVWASCMVDGYTNVAGGGQYRKLHGQRMRFKVLHKVHDFKQRFGYDMCVGCGRCDDVCPEYIKFANAVTKMADVLEEREEV